MSFRIPRSQVTAAIFMALVLTAVFATQAARATAPESAVKISVIDTEKILLSSTTGKKAVADLKKLQDAAENQLKSQQQEIQDLQKRINEGRLSLSQDRLAQLNKQLEDKTIALRRAQDDATRDLNKKRDDMLAAIRSEGDADHQPDRQGDGLHSDLSQVRERADLRRRCDRHYGIGSPAIGRG